MRGGYIEAGDMERIVNYMDEEGGWKTHAMFAAGINFHENVCNLISSDHFLGEIFMNSPTIIYIGSILSILVPKRAV